MDEYQSLVAEVTARRDKARARLDAAREERAAKQARVLPAADATAQALRACIAILEKAQASSTPAAAPTSSSQAPAAGAPASQDKGHETSQDKDHEPATTPTVQDKGPNTPASQVKGPNTPASQDKGLTTPNSQNTGHEATQDKGIATTLSSLARVRKHPAHDSVPLTIANHMIRMYISPTGFDLRRDGGNAWRKYVRESFPSYVNATTISDLSATMYRSKQGRPPHCAVCNHSLSPSSQVYETGVFKLHVACLARVFAT